MKANELMIGDIVNLGYRDLALKVLGIDAKKGVVFVEVQDNFKLQISYDEEEIKPFPLTEEMLKLNGFIHKETMEEWWHEEYDPEWGMRMSDFELTDEFKFGRAKLTYVHELQHALRLCGLNELADNFKVE